MANEKTIHGRIDCPCCGAHEGVRVTTDKNGQPFGFCDAKCGLQLRIGGDAYRVNEFYKRHPKIAADMRGEPVTVSEPAQAQTPQKPTEKTGFSLEDL